MPTPIKPPSRKLPSEHSPRYDLYKGVREAVLSLPSYFRTDTYIEGISATDIFTLSATLSAAIETQLVSTLNRVRTIWDPHEQFQLYSFVRQPQTFPDVRLQRAQPTKESDNVLLGIELKAW